MVVVLVLVQGTDLLVLVLVEVGANCCRYSETLAGWRPSDLLRREGRWAERRAGWVGAAGGAGWWGAGWAGVVRAGGQGGRRVS